MESEKSSPLQHNPGVPLAVILFGPPGSGKGTQARLLREALQVPHVSTGDMLRDRIASADPVGLEVQGLMQAGRLVPDETVNLLVADRISAPDCARGFILDGYPRTLQQAVALDRLFEERGYEPLVIHLKVDYTKVIARISGRRMCPVCGTLYSLASNPPRQPDFCDRDNARLVVRDDDKESVVRERLESYERQTRPVLEYFSAAGSPFHEVDGSDGSPDEIFARVRGLLSVA